MIFSTNLTNFNEAPIPPQQVNPPSSPTNRFIDKKNQNLEPPNFSTDDLSCLMHRRKNSFANWNYYARTRYLESSRCQKGWSRVVCRDRELRPRERSDPSGGSFRLIRLNPSVCVVALRGKGGVRFSIPNNTKTGYGKRTLLKRRRRKKHATRNRVKRRTVYLGMGLRAVLMRRQIRRDRCLEREDRSMFAGDREKGIRIDEKGW